MPTQQEIAEHLDMTQQAVSAVMERLAIDWTVTSMEEIRKAYIRNLRGQASGHASQDGDNLIRERVLTERVDRELKQLQVAEKRGMLINVEQLEPELMNMVGAFRSELLARDDKLKGEIDTLYGVNIDIAILNEHTIAALEQFGRYDPCHRGLVASPGGSIDAAGTDLDHRVGDQVSADVGEGRSEPGTV